ncbi:MAG TPA: carboxylesterase family protein [Edaphobacter sp.]|uniref:carboxylesterase/lipase family protein n=1 Tax=Edaphobacter sp. TaxID=1934404 RepID=UPI002C56A1B8|nr:carboxylesterase family protein [Edaphobacter sp.]HUZ93893.1 carboxylesterase family protein [Edaphobacter sp.]
MSESSNRTILTRREALLLSATAGVSLAAGRSAFASDSIKTAAHQEPGNCSTPRSAVAKTQYGKVRGFVDGGVFTFKGVPYGQTTADANRWLPAKPPTPWTDVYPALVYGANCPQTLHPWTSIEQTFLQDWDDGWQSEDMLKLNIWTPGLTGKLPVMLYMHGGGYSFGSSYELPSHEGAQMARHHNVVQVSVNHRLNILGFFDVSEVGGSAYEDSANVGMTDLVAALRWVHENIENFGGDPDRVMIYGQSGGGSKVTTLMGMPSAEGLFHRAAAQSGGGGNIPSREQQTEVARLVMKDLGLAANDIESLQKMEWSRLFAAGNAAVARINPEGPRMMGPGAPGKPRVGWSPCVDGKVINMRSFFDAAPEISRNVPLLIGSVSEEGNRMSSNPTEKEWHAGLSRAYGEEKATAIVAALKKAYPQKQIRTLSYMCSGSFGLNGLSMRNNVVKMARLKHELKAAPAYAYYFTWQTQMLDGIPGAWHTSDLQFCFDNTRRCEQGTGNTPEAQVLEKKMAASWAEFAATGNPSIPGLKWEPTDPQANRTMIWDSQCRVADDPEGEARSIILA